MSPADILDWQRRVLADSRLDRGEKLLAISLALRINSGTGTCYPSIPRIAQDNGITERQVYRVLATLEATGHIRRDRNPGKQNVYRLATTQGVTLPSPLEATDTTQEDARPLTYMSPPPDIHVRGTPDIHVTQKEQSERANRKRVQPAPSGTCCARSAAMPEDGEDARPQTPAQGADTPPPRVSNARPIPPDWQPDARTREWIASKGVSMEEARPAVIEFRAWAQDTQVKRKSWDRTFMNNGPVKSALRRVLLDRQRRPQAAPLAPVSGPAYRDARAVLAEIGL